MAGGASLTLAPPSLHGSSGETSLYHCPTRALLSPFSFRPQSTCHPGRTEPLSAEAIRNSSIFVEGGKESLFYFIFNLIYFLGKGGASFLALISLCLSFTLSPHLCVRFGTLYSPAASPVVCTYCTALSDLVLDVPDRASSLDGGFGG